MALPKVPKLKFDDKGLPQSGDPFELMLVHMMPKEASLLDAQQGGGKIDPQTGLREYSDLGPVYETPEVRDLFLGAAQEAQDPMPDPPELDALYKIGEFHTQKFQRTPEDNYGPVKSLEEEGRDGDTILVLLPKNMVILFGLARGGLSKNPETGLFEFGGNVFKKVFSAPARAIAEVLRAVGVKDTHANEISRGLGAVGGFMLGGPLGAGLGNAYANYSTGKSAGNSLWGGAKIGGLAYGAQQLPSLWAGAQGLMETLGGAGAASAAGAAAAPAAAGAAAATGAAAAAAPAAAESAAATGAKGLSSLLGPLGTPAGLLAMQHGFGILGSRQKYKNEKEEIERQRRENDEHLRKMGVYDRWTPPNPIRTRPNPLANMRTTDEVERGIFPYHPLEQYKKGGPVNGSGRSSHGPTHSSTLIKGPGKGQDDKIRTSVPNGSYIIDASSVGMFGDGSSEEGAKVLQRYLNKLKGPRKVQTKTPSYRSGGEVPVFLSNDEFIVKPHDVEAVGGGNNDKGSYILKGMVRELRKHKRSNGDCLPPRAKDPARYVQLSRRT